MKIEVKDGKIFIELEDNIDFCEIKHLIRGRLKRSADILRRNTNCENFLPYLEEFEKNSPILRQLIDSANLYDGE